VIVVDASAILEVLLQTRAAERVMDRLFGRPQTFHAPHLIDVEVLQVLRRYVAGREIVPVRAEEALAVFSAIPLERYSHELLLGRMWQLRRNLTAYDASYVALAELLEVPLLTRDARLVRSTGHHAEIELIG
jgi:predicted nucleic acid-binding protein